MAEDKLQETEQLEETGREMPEPIGGEKTETAAETESLPETDNRTGSEIDPTVPDWRQNRDAGAVAREVLEKEETKISSLPALSKRQQRRQEREEERRRKQQARQNEQADKLRTRQEKKDRRAQARQERRREIKALWRTVEFVMLVTFIVLAIDQAGLYGFLFVWLFIAVAAASVVLMLVGVIRALAKKRTGLILLTGVIGIAASVIWFLFLASSQGMGLGML